MTVVAYTLDTAVICQGDSLLVGGAFQTTSGIYFDTLSTSTGCDSVIETNLTVVPVTIDSLTVTICEGDSLFVGGGSQTIAGVYYDTLTNIGGCDSIIVTTLNVDSLLTGQASATLCFGDTLNWNGQVITISGTYTDTISTGGCDSIVTYLVTVDSGSVEFDSINICAGDSVFVGGAFQTISGTYFDSLSNINGCDSIIVTTLQVDSVLSSTASVSICQGDSILIGGMYQTTAGVYFDTLMSSGGCDSVVITTLTVDSIQMVSWSDTICQGDIYNGQFYLFDTTLVDTFTSTTGCDSITMIDLTVHPTYNMNMQSSICEGDTFFVGQVAYTTAGNIQHDIDNKRMDVTVRSF